MLRIGVRRRLPVRHGPLGADHAAGAGRHVRRGAHTFQALYVGLPPAKALAVYAVVAHMDTVGGVYFPASGGMHAVPRALAAAAGKAGAVIRYGVRAERVETDSRGVAAVRLEGGERLPAGAVVVACDLAQAHRGLLPEAAGDWRRRPQDAT